MTPARCATCDRAECPDLRTQWMYYFEPAARQDCRAHAVDWRARCLAAETERIRQVADLQALIEHRIAETFAAGATMRLCRHCGDVTVGGPTACSGCVRAEALAEEIAQLRGDRCNVCDEDGLIYPVVGFDASTETEIDGPGEVCPECGGTRSGFASQMRAERDGAISAGDTLRIARDDARAAAIEWKAKADRGREEIARLGRENDALRQSRQADRYAAADRVTEMHRRAQAAESERDAAIREADRWRHGVPVECDYVCPDSLALAEARAERDRLAASAGDWGRWCAQAVLERDRLAAEVERLRARLAEFVSPRELGCVCTWEQGDSACPVHQTCAGCGGATTSGDGTDRMCLACLVSWPAIAVAGEPGAGEK